MHRGLPAALALLLVSASFAACENAGANDPIEHSTATIPGVTFDNPAAKEKLGQDDGMSAVIFYGGEMLGSIDDCGCPSHPQGGLPWRLGYAQGFRAAYPEVGFLQVDAGQSMSSIMDDKGHLFADSVVKGDWVIKALDHFDFDAANISHDDIYYLSQFLHTGGVWEKALADHPILGRYVSANLVPTRPDLVAPPAYVVRTLKGSRVPNGSMRIAFIGLTQNSAIVPSHTGFRIDDPQAALAKVVDKARGEADAVVVLAYMDPDAIKALAKSPGGAKVDAFIAAHPRAHDTEAVIDGSTRLLFARYQTRQLGELHLFFNGQKIDHVTNRYVTLDEQIPKNPDAEKMAADAKAAVKKAQEDRFNMSGPQPTTQLPEGTPVKVYGTDAPAAAAGTN